MKVAILILAHKNLEQLELLITSLCGDFDIYVHVDSKWDIPLKELNLKYNNVVFFKEYDIAWGGRNIMLATISLFKIAGAKNLYDYYFFISGQDLPLKTNEHIIKELEELNGASLVKYRRASDGDLDRMRYYWENDTKNPIFRYAIKIIRKLQRILRIKRSLYPINVYYRHSMWFALHKNALRYVLEFLDKNPKYIKKLKYTTLIDEIWLATILVNSNIKVLDKQSSFVNWTTGPEYPRTLRMVDFEGVIKQDCLFARKFDMDVDKEVIYKFINNRQ